MQISIEHKGLPTKGLYCKESPTINMLLFYQAFAKYVNVFMNII